MTMIFVNLPVRDLRVAADFWAALGYATDPRFTDEHSTNVQISDGIVLMLLDHARFADFVIGAVADPAAGTGALYALSADSREAVDRLVDRALEVGGATYRPTMDHGFMYGRSFTDPDGHVFEVMWMDVAAAQQAGVVGQDQLSGASS